MQNSGGTLSWFAKQVRVGLQVSGPRRGRILRQHVDPGLAGIELHGRTVTGEELQRGERILLAPGAVLHTSVEVVGRRSGSDHGDADRVHRRSRSQVGSTGTGLENNHVAGADRTV